MSHELFNLLPDTMTREEKERVCSKMLDAFNGKVQTNPWLGSCVQCTDIAAVCAIPPEPEKPLSTTAICSKCGHVFTNGDNATVAHGVFTCFPTCPPKQEVEGLEQIVNEASLYCICPLCRDNRDSFKCRIAKAIKAVIKSVPTVGVEYGATDTTPLECFVWHIASYVDDWAK